MAQAPSIRSLIVKNKHREDGTSRVFHPDLDSGQRLLGLVREIRAETQNLLCSLTDLRKKADVVDAAMREQQVQATLAENATLFAYNQEEIRTRVQALRRVLDQNADLHQGCGDEVVKLENCWEHAALGWPRPEQSGDEILQRAEKTDKQLSNLVRQCGIMTIPHRVNDHLRQLRVGQPLDFHLAFKDELPLLVDRQEVLHYLAAHPKAVEGVVDMERGLIHRTSPSKGRQAVSGGVLVFLPVLGGILLWLATQFFIDSPNEPAFNAYLLAYIALLAGGVVHILVGAIKQARSGQNLLALSDWWLWLHAKEPSLVWGVIYLWIGFIGLLVWQRTALQPLTAFFVGYSVDSLVDLFLERFNKFAASSVEAVKARI